MSQHEQEQTKTLTAEERASLGAVVGRRDRDVSILIHGEGENRCVSLYAEGTRLEARIALPAPPTSRVGYVSDGD